jgi:hypothetical protein
MRWRDCAGHEELRLHHADDSAVLLMIDGGAAAAVSMG